MTLSSGSAAQRSVRMGCFISALMFFPFPFCFFISFIGVYLLTARRTTLRCIKQDFRETNMLESPPPQSPDGAPPSPGTFSWDRGVGPCPALLASGLHPPALCHGRGGFSAVHVDAVAQHAAFCVGTLSTQGAAELHPDCSSGACPFSPLSRATPCS